MSVNATLSLYAGCVLQRPRRTYIRGLWSFAKVRGIHAGLQLEVKVVCGLTNRLRFDIVGTHSDNSLMSLGHMSMYNGYLASSYVPRVLIHGRLHAVATFQPSPEHPQ